LYEVGYIPGALGYHWSVSPAATATISGSGSVGELVVYQSGEYFVSLAVDTECGLVTVANINVNASDCTGGFNNFQAYPNPAGGTMTVTSQGEMQSLAGARTTGPATRAAKTSATKLIPFTYKVYDQFGKVWLEGKSVSGEDLKTDVSHIPSGTYYIHFINGKQVVRKQLIIKH
jgi:hypothetical protein